MKEYALSVLDPSGHTEVRWDPSNPESCAEALAAVEGLVAKGYTLFVVTGPGQGQVRKPSEFFSVGGRIDSPPVGVLGTRYAWSSGMFSTGNWKGPEGVANE
jgi:hypothetical protein